LDGLTTTGDPIIFEIGMYCYYGTNTVVAV
jgi:hypothetical protein